MPAVRHTPEQRAEALRLYREQGPSAAARETHVPIGTIASWARRAGVQMDPATQAMLLRKATEAAKLSREERVARLADDLLRVAESRTQAVLDEVSVKDAQTLMATVAIAVDKSQLLAGHATSRIESNDPEQVRSEIAAMQAAWRQRQSA